MQKKTWVKLALGCLGAGLLFMVVAGVAVWFFFIREAPKLEVELSLPAEAVVGQTVEMVVKATNPYKNPVTLDSIDVASEFLAGFRVEGVDPKPKSTMHIPLVGGRSWDFGTAVTSGGTMTVKFRLRALATGRFAGDVDVCNTSQDYTTNVADVIVTEPSAPQAGNKR